MHLSDLSARSGPETNVVQSWVATPAIGMIDGIRAVRAPRGQPRRQPPNKLSAFSTYRVAAPSRISSPAPPYCHSARAHAVPRTGPSGLAQATQDWRHRFDEGVQPPTAPPAADGDASSSKSRTRRPALSFKAHPAARCLSQGSLTSQKHVQRSCRSSRVSV